VLRSYCYYWLVWKQQLYLRVFMPFICVSILLCCWIKIDHLDVTCFIISLFTAQHVSNVTTSIFRSLRLIVDLFHGFYCSGLMCVGVMVWFGWGGVVSLCRLKHCFSLHKDMSVEYIIAMHMWICCDCPFKHTSTWSLNFVVGWICCMIWRSILLHWPVDVVSILR